MDGVNISGNEEAGKGSAPRKGRPKKELTASTKTSSREERDKKGGGMVSTLVAVTVTALIVGGGVYLWLRSENKTAMEKLMDDTRNARMDLEQRIESVKNKLTTKEKEVEELSTVKKDLEEKSKLLDVAKIDYRDNDLGFKFQYPVSFGEVKIEKIQGVSGLKFVGSFSANPELYFGGVSKNFKMATTSDASSTVFGFADSFGFISEGNKYYYQSMDGEQKKYEIEPMRMVDSGLGKTLLLNKDSFVKGKDGSVWDFGLGNDIGAIANIKNSKFEGGLVFINKNTAKFPLADFEESLKSVK